MDRTTIYTRTDKSDRAVAAPSEPAPGLDRILEAIDGKSSVEDLAKRFNDLSTAELEVGLAALAEGYFIVDAAGSTLATGLPSPQSDESVRKAQELRAKIRERRKGGDRSGATPATDAWHKLRREAEEKAKLEAADRARQDAEEQARRKVDEQLHREAEEKARLEAAERVRQDAEQKARREAEEKIQREAAERSRQEAEERARQAAEEQARRDAEEEARKAAERIRQEAEAQARREAEEEARREATERARLEAEEQARRDAEEEARKAAERARQEAEEQARRDAEEEVGREAAERARQRAEVQTRLMAEEQEWLETEEKAKLAQEATKERDQARAAALAQAEKARSAKPRNWVKPVTRGAAGLVVLGLVALHLIPFDGQIPQFEKALSAQFQQPVKIKALHLALVPRPHVRLDGVSIGSEGQIKVPGISAAGDLRNLYREQKAFSSIELDSPVITAEGLGWILFGERGLHDMAFGEVDAVNATLDSKAVSLPAFDAKMQSAGDGVWKTISIVTADKNLGIELVAQGRSVKIDAKARTFQIPFGSALTLEDFVAVGTADRAGLALSEFKGFAYGGTLGGSAKLTWGANWSLTGELNAKQIDTARLIPELMDSARVEGKASYAMQAPEAAKLVSTTHMEGRFSIPRGTLLGVDLGILLQGGNRRGDTSFAELGGSFVYDRGAIQLRQLRLSQGNMSASGTLDVDAEKNVRGRFAGEIRLTTEQRRANLAVSGTLNKLVWQRQ